MNNAYICVAAAARFCFQLKCFSYSRCIFCDHRVGCLVGEPPDRRIRIAGKLRECIGIDAFKSAVKIRRNVVIGDEAVEAPESKQQRKQLNGDDRTFHKREAAHKLTYNRKHEQHCQHHYEHGGVYSQTRQTEFGDIKKHF